MRRNFDRTAHHRPRRLEVGQIHHVRPNPGGVDLGPKIIEPARAHVGREDAGSVLDECLHDGATDPLRG